MDGTHIPGVIPKKDEAPFYNRKKDITHKLMGVVDFHGCFVCIMAGWEVSAHDASVLIVAMHTDLSDRGVNATW